jgi:hypothetical protein
VIPCAWMLRASVAAVVLAAVAAPAHAYEFWLRAQAIGQAYQLRDYRLIGPDLFLGRRRYTQTLALRIWDVGDLAAARRQAHLPDRGLRISWQSYLRIDHDFGDYTGGRVTLPLTVPVRRDALDVTPELGASVASLELLYGYLELAGMLDDRLTLHVGRVLADDGWGTTGVWRCHRRLWPSRCRRGSASAPAHRWACRRTSSTAPPAQRARSTSRDRLRARGPGS